MHLRIERPNGTSWPSTHPAVLLSFLTVTSKDLGAGPIARAALDGLAGTIGTSRVYVGVHFPSDVAGGILLGKSVAAAFDDDRR
jgi:undecaprenyl-diphosphatase